MSMKKGKQKALENVPDTRGVVGTAQGQIRTGRIAGQANFNGNSPSRNRMVSGNSGLKRG